MKLSIRLLTLTLLTGFATMGPAYAHDDNRGHGHGHGKQKKHYSNYSHHDRYDRYAPYGYWNVSLSPRERDEIERRMQEEYWRKCGNVAGRRYYDCRHGQYYQVGRRLPPDVVVWDLPYGISRKLPRPHSDTRYAWVGNDILLIARWDGTVLDSVLSLR